MPELNASDAYTQKLSLRELRSIRLAVAARVLRMGLAAGHPSAIVDAFECLVTSPFAREKNIGFYTLGSFYLRFTRTDADKLDLLVWLQVKVAGFVALDRIALKTMLRESTEQYTDESIRLSVSGVLRSVRLHRPMERVLLALDEAMPRLALAG